VVFTSSKRMRFPNWTERLDTDNIYVF